MDINLQSVLDQLIKEERDEASNLLHNWFVQHCNKLHKDLIRENDQENAEDEDEEDVEESEQTDENLSPISGISNADDDVDDFVNPEDSRQGDVDNVDGMDDEDLEDRVEDLETELASLRSEIQSALGVDTDTAGNQEGDVDDTEGDDEDGQIDFSFEDLEESFELEKVATADMNSAKYSGTGGKTGTENNHSPVPNYAPDQRFRGGPVKFGGEEKPHYVGDSVPTVKPAKLFKNQVKNAESNLEKVSPTGPKGALLNNKGSGFSSDNNDSLMGGKRDLRGKSLREQDEDVNGTVGSYSRFTKKSANKADDKDDDEVKKPAKLVKTGFGSLKRDK